MEHGKFSSGDKYIGLNRLIINRGTVLVSRGGPFYFKRYRSNLSANKFVLSTYGEISTYFIYL